MRGLIQERGTIANPRKEGTGVSKDNPIGLKYIYRIEADWRPGPRENVGWRAKFPSNQKFYPVSKSFYDDSEGGRKRSLEKAIAWRDMMMRKHNVLRTPRRMPRVLTTRSPIGVSGVYRHTSRNLYVALYANSPEDHGRVYFGFGPGRASERDALLTAVKYRLAQEKRIYGRVVSTLPRWIEQGLRTMSPSRFVQPTSELGQRYMPAELKRAAQKSTTQKSARKQQPKKKKAKKRK